MAARLAPCSERLERLRSVWLGLAARCSEVPYVPLGGGIYAFRPWPVGKREKGNNLRYVFTPRPGVMLDARSFYSRQHAGAAVFYRPHKLKGDVKAAQHVGCRRLQSVP